MTIFPSGSRLLQPVGLNRHSASNPACARFYLIERTKNVVLQVRKTEGGKSHSIKTNRARSRMTQNGKAEPPEKNRRLCLNIMKIMYFSRTCALKNTPMSSEDSDNERSEAHESCASVRNSHIPIKIRRILIESVSGRGLHR